MVGKWWVGIQPSVLRAVSEVTFIIHPSIYYLHIRCDTLVTSCRSYVKGLTVHKCIDGCLWALRRYCRHYILNILLAIVIAICVFVFREPTALMASLKQWETHQVSERELFLRRCIFNHYYAVCPEATEFSEITQNKDHCAVRGHSRSPILVPIESSYTNSY